MIFFQNHFLLTFYTEVAVAVIRQQINRQQVKRQQNRINKKMIIIFVPKAHKSPGLTKMDCNQLFPDEAAKILVELEFFSCYKSCLKIISIVFRPN